jgi:hypothetical protein
MNGGRDCGEGLRLEDIAGGGREGGRDIESGGCEDMVGIKDSICH